MADDHTFLDIVADPGASADLDVVAIHGLNPYRKDSNAYTTWTAVKKKDENNWIKDPEFLPKSLPSARIMIFGYNSHAVFNASEANVNEHAGSLLQAIWQKTRKNASGRPLIFICHSLGGLLAKRSLIMASLPNSKYESIYTNTKGMVFFATPHGGSGKVQVGKIATTIARVLSLGRDNAFMEALSRNSLCGDATRKDFNNICQRMSLISFFETLPTSKVMVVEKEDATCGLSEERETALPLNANHSDICKFFDPKGRDYINVKEPLEELAEKVLSEAKGPIGTESVPPRTADRNGIYLVPYLTNTKFQGRSYEIEHVKSFFSSESSGQASQKRMVIQGFPGVGKTSIAVQYAASQKGFYDGIFWVTASTKSNVDTCYAQFEEKVKEATGKPFLEWCSSHKWLLIVDNWDDPTSFQPRSSIPPDQQGHVLITTRRTNLTQIGTVFKIAPLTPQAASRLLLSYASEREPEDQEEDHALAIVRLLGYLPLAIRHCGCSISAQGSRLSSYVVEFERLMEELVMPEEMDYGFDTFDLDDTKPIIATFEVSFKQVTDDAAHVLQLLANLDPTDVSLRMLERCLEKHKHWDANGDACIDYIEGMPRWPLDLQKKAFGRGLSQILKNLVTYSLVLPKAQDGHYYLHPMTHFFLRWRQDRNVDLDSFVDSARFLLNGFPHPDFSRVYGLSHEHLSLRETLLSHVMHLNTRYTKLQGYIEDPQALYAVATLFLHASLVPREHRPPLQWRQSPLAIMTQNQTKHVPADIKAKAQKLGNYMETYVQDITLLPSIENILRQTGYPAYLFFQAVQTIFSHISTTWLAKNYGRGFNVENLVFAGRSVEQVRKDTITAKSPRGPRVHLAFHLGGESFDNQIASLLPLLYKENVQADTPMMFLGRESGALGLLAITFVAHLRDSVWNQGPQINVDAEGHMTLVIDNRFHLPTQIPCAWIFTNENFKDRPMCDLYRFTIGQLSMLAFEALRDRPKFPLRPELVAKYAEHAVELFTRICLPESTVAAAGLFMLLYEHKDRTPPLTNVPQARLQELLYAPVTSRNYYFKVKLTDAWADNLRAREPCDLSEIETLLLRSLRLFESAEEKVKKSWVFGLDPILDILEFLIVYYRDWAVNELSVQKYRNAYRVYFDGRYNHPLLRLCLGCGAGVFGMSFSRLRLLMEVPLSSSNNQLDVNLVERLQASLGCSGTSFPEADQHSPRYIEQDWCRFRYNTFISMLQNRHVDVTVTTFGQMEFGGSGYKMGISPDTYAAEEDRIRHAMVSSVLE